MMKKIIIGALVAFFSNAVFAALQVPIYLTTSTGEEAIGTVSIETRLDGLLLTPSLKGLPPGVHGFHVHEHASCVDHGMAAGGHLDPAKTDKHEGPYEDGHLGDLPVLIVDNNGLATLPVFAPRLKLKDVVGHTLMIHAGGDNYSDMPEKLGGGGARIACGVIKK